MKIFKFNLLTVALLSLLLFSACNKEVADQANADGSAATESSEGGEKAATGSLPVLTFADADENGGVNHEFGEISQGEVVSKVFKFTNTGTADLKITDMKVSCGCTTPSYTKDPVAPGAPGEITVQFDSKGKCGAQNKTVTVIANTEPRGTVIRFKAEIKDCENES